MSGHLAASDDLVVFHFYKQCLMWLTILGQVFSYSMPDAGQLGAEGEISFKGVCFCKCFKGQISQYEKMFWQKPCKCLEQLKRKWPSPATLTFLVQKTELEYFFWSTKLLVFIKIV